MRNDCLESGGTFGNKIDVLFNRRTNSNNQLNVTCYVGKTISGSILSAVRFNNEREYDIREPKRFPNELGLKCDCEYQRERNSVQQCS